MTRHLNPEKGIIPCPFLKRRGWCVKGARCDFKHPRDDEKHLVPCPLGVLAAISLIAIAIRLLFHHPDRLTTSVLPPFIKGLLSNREQCVRIGNASSSWKKTNGGLPQGTKLGPLLFAVLINSLLKDWPARIKFVDDTSALEMVPRYSPSFSH